MKKRMRYLLGHDTDDMVTKITEVQAAQVSEMMSMLAFFKMLKDDVMPYIAPAYRPIALNHWHQWNRNVIVCVGARLNLFFLLNHRAPKSIFKVHDIITLSTSEYKFDEIPWNR